MNKIILTNTTKRNILWLFLSLVSIYLIFNLFTYFELSYLLEDSIDSRLKHEMEHISSAVGFYNDSIIIKNMDEFQETDLREVTQTPFFLKIYNEKGKPEPVFFYNVAVRNGVLNCEVPENEKMMKSTHFQPSTDSETSSLIYEFNQNEKNEAVL